MTEPTSNLQLKPNRWSCSVTSWAMALHVPVSELIEKIGHDGGDIIFPSLDEPRCRRGFHPQELVLAAWDYGFACTPIELFPALKTADGGHEFHLLSEADCWAPFSNRIKANFGVLEGQCRRCQHSVHFRSGYIFDPDGDYYWYSPEALEAHGFYSYRIWLFTSFH